MSPRYLTILRRFSGDLLQFSTSLNPVGVSGRLTFCDFKQLFQSQFQAGAGSQGAADGADWLIAEGLARPRPDPLGPPPIG